MGVIKKIPLAVFKPFRIAVVRLPRGNFLRNACTLVLKQAKKGQRIGDRLKEVRPLDDPTVCFVASDSMVIDAVYWFGLRGYEGILADLWGALASKANSVLEIGGNIGFYSVIGGRRSKATYSVIEPIPENVAILRENLRRNGISRLEVIEGAVIPSSKAQRVKLNIPDEGRGAPVGAHLLGSEVRERSSLRVVETQGIPMAQIARGRDLIKIDAEGIEAELIHAIRDEIWANRPTLVLEVLPEAEKLAATVRELAAAYGNIVNVIPAWGSDRIVSLPAKDFTSRSPEAHNSKDIILSSEPIVCHSSWS